MADLNELSEKLSGIRQEIKDELLKIENKYSDVIILKNDINTKPGAARNLGLEYATADYILFIDSDDWIDSDYCEKLYNVAISNDCDMVMCNVVRDFGNGKKINLKNQLRKLIKQLIIFKKLKRH